MGPEIQDDPLDTDRDQGEADTGIQELVEELRSGGAVEQSTLCRVLHASGKETVDTVCNVSLQKSRENVGNSTHDEQEG